MSKFNEAVVFAAEKHDGQYRKITNQPYIFHCMEVAQIVSEMTYDEDVMIAALLHDTVEDTKTTLDELEYKFGPKVMRLVSYETEDKRKGQNKSDTWKIRKEESLLELKNCHDEDVKKIWLGDKLSNVRSLYRSYLILGDNLWNSFNEKDPKNHAWYYREVVKNLDELKDYAPYKELDELVEKLFGGYDE